MGCVSGEEVMVIQADRMLEGARAAVARDWPALRALVALVDALRLERPQVTIPDFERSLALATARIAEGPNPPAYTGPTCHKPSTHDEIRLLEREAEFYHALAREFEDALCVLRCWIATVLRDAPLPRKHRLLEALRAQMTLHRAHREEDRREAIQRCLDAIANAERGSMSSFVVNVERDKLARLRALDESTLLCDRSSTRI